MAAIEIYPHEALPGDRILGTQLVVAHEGTYKHTAMINGEEQSSELLYGAGGGWTLPLTNGRTISYGYNRKITVIR